MRQRSGSTNRRQQNQVRIIGGKWRGRKFSFPDADGLRPTGDRIRETLFNWLAPELPGARICDLFAGSGALGFEAASRGADSVVMLEKDKAVFRQLQSSATSLGCGKDVEIQNEDALNFLQHNRDNTSDSARFDIIFLDPPFHTELLTKSLELLNSGGFLNPGALIYIETAINEPVPCVPGAWKIYRDKTAGQVRFQLYRANKRD